MKNPIIVVARTATLVTMIFTLGCENNTPKSEEDTESQDSVVKTPSVKTNDQSPDPIIKVDSTEIFEPIVSPEATSDEAISDSELAGETVTSGIDVAISSLADESDIATSSLSLRAASKKVEFIRFRECQKQEYGAAHESIKRKLTREFSLEGARRKVESNFVAQGEINRVWDKPEIGVDCSEDGRYALMPWGDLQGLSLESEFSKSRLREITFASKISGKSFSRSHKFAAQGVHQISWNAVTDDSGMIAIEKTIAKDVTRTMEFQNSKGRERSMVRNFKTKADYPLNVTVERDSTTYVVVSRTINQGALVATGKSGRMELEFDHVKWTNACMADSGTISGSLFKPDSTQPEMTFEISFSGDSKSIVFSNGEQFEYTPEGCELENPDNPEDVSSDEVSASL
jgi:hypothetical protein